MNWNRATVITLLSAVATIVSGGYIAKHVSVEAGSALIALGAGLVMWLRPAPGFAQSAQQKAAQPEKELP